MAMMDDDKDINRGPDLNAEIGRRRGSGNCARHQRKVQLAVKRARNIALLPFTVTH
jgi:small subunit ribosomal protein S18